MREPEVDVVGAQPPERGVELVHQGAPRDVDPAFVAHAVDPRLGADDEVLARYDLVEHLADARLGVAAAVPVGGVDQLAPGIEEGADVVAGLVAVDRVAPRHRPEGERGDPEARGADTPVHDHAR